ncbi:MAG TPA: hypothetical protein PKB02_17165 [Anaerohalosphaeraceae bacterium]|nr:hypothetical protein [Anaerohalosphaeraceae bacterium]
MEQEDKHEKLRELKGWFMWFAVVGVVIVGVMVLFVCTGRSELERKIAELKAQGIPTSFAELGARHKLPAGTPNAADVYAKAFAAYRPVVDPQKLDLLPVLGNGQRPEDNAPYPQEQMDAAKEFIEANQAMYDLLHQGGQIPDCAYPRDYSSSQTVYQSNNLDVLHIGIQSLYLATLYYAQQGQAEQAVEYLKDEIHFSESLSEGDFLFDHMIQMAIIAMCAENAGDCLNSLSLSAEQLQDFQNGFQRLRSQMSFKNVLIGEICYQLDYYYNPYPPGVSIASSAQTRLLRASGLYERNILQAILWIQDMMAVEELPVGEQLAGAHAVGQKLKELSSLYYLTKGLSGVVSIYEDELVNRAKVDALITGLAIERYRLAEGKLPETLDELVPGYLPEVFIDPTDGKPLKYEQNNPGYRVYTGDIEFSRTQFSDVYKIHGEFQMRR